MRRKKFLRVLIFTLATAFFIAACSGVDSGSDPLIYGTWKTTEMVTLNIEGNCSQEMPVGSALVLNDDKSYSFNFNGGYFSWPMSGGGTSSARTKDTFSGTFSFDSANAFSFSFADKSCSTTYKFIITYSELSSNSVTLSCTVVTTNDSTDITNTFTLHCNRE